MNTNEQPITKDTVVDLQNKEQVEKAATWLYEALGQAFNKRECRMRLSVSMGYVAEAAERLARGEWKTFKLVSWNWEALNPKCKALVEQTGLSQRQCMDVLQNCAGNEALAARMLAGLPALP